MINASTTPARRNPQDAIAAVCQRTPQEMFAATGRFRRKAAQIRGLLADPGEGCEDFLRCGPAQARHCEALANELETLAAVATN